MIVVHLYEASVQSCVRMNNILEELAEDKFKHVKFLRYDGTTNDLGLDRMTLPILMVYRDGEPLEVLAGLEQELGSRFTAADVEWLLESHFQSLGVNY